MYRSLIYVDGKPFLMSVKQYKHRSNALRQGCWALENEVLACYTPKSKFITHKVVEPDGKIRDKDYNVFTTK